MKLRNDILFNKDDRYSWSVDDFRLPETMACVPKEGQVILDECFQPLVGLLDHSLKGLLAGGIPKFVGYGVLTGLSQDGMIRAGIETRADEMTRKWGKLTGSDDNDKLAAIGREMNRFKIPAVINRASACCGYYGGCLGFIDNGENQDSLANPLVLSPDTFRRGSLRGIRLIEPYTVTPAGYNSINPMAEDYFRPAVWYVQGIPVHESRMLYFAENELPTIIRPAYNFFGLPLAQKVMDAVSHYTVCREAAARLLEKYALTVFKTDMSEILEGGMTQVLEQRIKYFIQNRDNNGCAAIDRDKEDIVIMTTSLAGVTDLVRQAEEYVASMFCEPVTKMWGLSPSGFNAGDSDLRNHYDNIQSLQEKILYDPMQRIIKILQLNKFGVIDPSITFEFNPLSDEDENMKISTAQARCTINTAYMEAGVLSAEEVRGMLINDPDSGYDGLDPELPPQPVLGEGEELSPFDPDEGEEGAPQEIAPVKKEEAPPDEKVPEKKPVPEKNTENKPLKPAEEKSAPAGENKGEKTKETAKPAEEHKNNAQKPPLSNEKAPVKGNVPPEEEKGPKGDKIEQIHN